MGIPRALLVPVASARASLISAALAQQRFDAVNATDVDAQRLQLHRSTLACRLNLTQQWLFILLGRAVDVHNDVLLLVRAARQA